MNRKKREDWLAAGLQVLGDQGLDGLTIQHMSTVLGVTKGSFYHHFNGIEDFETALLLYWAEPYLSTADDLPKDPRQRLALLDRIMSEAFSRVSRPEIAIRSWAHQNPDVQVVVVRVDKARTRFVYNVFSSLVSSDSQARLMTEMFSTMLIGSFMVLPPLERNRTLALYAEFKRLYGLG